jgi:hypothetical protein
MSLRNTNNLLNGFCEHEWLIFVANIIQVNDDRPVLIDLQPSKNSVVGSLDLPLYLRDEVNKSSHQTNIMKYPTPREKNIGDIAGSLACQSTSA